MTSTKTRITALALAALLAPAARAAVNEGVFTYSGYLRNGSGAAETTLQSLTFTLYDAAAGGNALWTQTVSVLPDAQGWFSAVLGTSPSALAPALFASQLWLGVKVGSEAEMTPRTKMGSSPRALAVDWGGVLNVPAACTAGQVLQGYTGSGDAICVSSGGVASVAKAPTAGNPIVVGGTPANPTIDLPAAGASAGGYLSAADWNAFDAKASTASPTFTGTVTAPTFSGALSGNATTATTALDASSLDGRPASFYQPAGTALTTSSLPGAGGRNGTATTVARSDHTHAPSTTVPLSDLGVYSGTASLGTVSMAPQVIVPAWNLAAEACISTAALIPAGTGGSGSTPPVVRLLAYSNTGGPGNVNFSNSGLAAGQALPPGSLWGAPDGLSYDFVAGQIVQVLSHPPGTGWSLGSFEIAGSSPPAHAGAGDLLYFRICGPSFPISIVSVALDWN
jgi:hypothetical protein